MGDWSKFEIPHVKYIGDNNPIIIDLYYLGGEVDKSLTIGKEYNIKTLLYAEKREDHRIKVWTCKDDNNKVIQININNFGDFIKLRESKINKILNDT